jgi:hypothetical protein
MKNWPLALVLAFPSAASAAEAPRVISDVVYGHKDGMALTYDVLEPDRQSGAAVLWIQSGGWYSTYADPKILVGASKGFLDKGYTVVIIRHGSAPKYTVSEAAADVRRAVRAVRLNARAHGIDPKRLGVMGMSAGGHLSLMLGTTGNDGDPKARDEVLRQSSRVAAVLAICPPTDLRGWTTDPPAEIKAPPPEAAAHLRREAGVGRVAGPEGDGGRRPDPADPRGRGHAGADRAQQEHRAAVREGGGGRQVGDRRGGRTRVHPEAEQGRTRRSWPRP